MVQDALHKAISDVLPARKRSVNKEIKGLAADISKHLVKAHIPAVPLSEFVLKVGRDDRNIARSIIIENHLARLELCYDDGRIVVREFN